MDDRERLLHWMQGRAMNQSELAEALGVTPQFISMILGGKRPVSTHVKWLFAECFGHNEAQQVFPRQPKAIAALGV